MNPEIKKLSLSIGECSNFVEVLKGGNNACKSVVDWQLPHHGLSTHNHDVTKSSFHRPEPWAGNLATAQVMFLSSNPSFDANENFPTLDWDDETTADFFNNRFSADLTRGYGAVENPEANDFDRALLKNNTFTKRVKTWYTLRSRAAVLLNKPVRETLAARDYVMTEVVHCKSRKEVGVDAALSVCVNKWLRPVLANSAARIIVVSGKPAGMAVKRAVDELTRGEAQLSAMWGSWNDSVPALGKWPTSNEELKKWKNSGLWEISDQESHIQDVHIDLNGIARTFTFMWMPHPVRSVPQKLDDPMLYDSKLLTMLQSRILP